jgi:uncharacterized membrane protein YphA (DoxX/SURF4 family)
MATHGMHFIPLLLGMALVIEAAGSACLALGLWSRTTAAVLFVYLGMVTVRLPTGGSGAGAGAGAGRPNPDG